MAASKDVKNNAVKYRVKMEKNACKVEKNWFATPRCILFNTEISDGEYRLLQLLMECDNYFNCEANASFICLENFMSQALNVNERTIRARIKHLTELNYININRTRNGLNVVNKYSINWDLINEKNNSFMRSINATNEAPSIETIVENKALPESVDDIDDNTYNCISTIIDSEDNQDALLNEYISSNKDNEAYIRKAFELVVQQQEMFNNIEQEYKNEQNITTAAQTTEESDSINLNGVKVPNDKIGKRLDYVRSKEGGLFYFSWVKSTPYDFAYSLINYTNEFNETENDMLQEYYIKNIMAQVSEVAVA